MKSLLTLVLAFTLLRSARAVEYSKAEFAGKSFTVCRVNVRKERLELFLRDEKGVPIKRFDKLAAWLQPRGRKLVFAMNAGMYNPDFSAEGLFVSAGREEAPLNTGKGYGNFFLKPNGVFVVTERGARVVETSEYPNLRDRVLLATQSGPLLVHNGVIHPAFLKDSTSRLFRNGVGVPAPDLALFVITEAPVNFYEFASLFRDELKCPDALFLDGTVSSLCAPALKRADFRMDLGPMIGVTE
ncbi:MAG TPA: phosphodiester glycosidase family protein [Chthoniobacteraceae bacterium]|jgi:uncharacterized protein YigE (DUF2233 family)|nr:phosphodiester glycosidase family protein [Chthoniobacteraceae bacterium]